MATTQRLTLVHVSDTHNMHRMIGEMPPADILLHTGDCTNHGTDAELADFDAWLAEQRRVYRHVIVIPGNHDWRQALADVEAGRVAPEALLTPDYHRARLPSATAVPHHESLEIDGLRIFGSGWCPWHASECPEGVGRQDPRKYAVWEKYCLAHGLTPEVAIDPSREPHVPSPFERIHEGVDILMTHGPPGRILDCMYNKPGRYWGSSELMRTHIERARPKVHLFGHLHEQRGFYQRQPDGTYAGVVEYEVVPGISGPCTTRDPMLTPEFPCDVVSCNAMANHPQMEGTSVPHIAGRPRVLEATRPDDGGRWSFRVVA